MDYSKVIDGMREVLNEHIRAVHGQDEPEGALNVTLVLSKTLAVQWLEALASIERPNTAEDAT